MKDLGSARWSDLRGLATIARLGRPVAPRLALAVIAGVAAAGAAIGLTATSAWLVSRAAQRPPVLDLMIAITGVRAFGVSRGAFRYAERLAAHDAAFRVLARLRGRAYERLEHLAPAGLAEFRSGDLLSRLVDDIDGLADIWLRVLLPYLVAGVAATVTTAAVFFLVPTAGIVLGISLVFVALGIPACAVAVAQRGERQIAGARGDLAAATLEVLAGAPELLVAGATEARLADLARIDGRLAAAEARTSAGFGLGAFLSGMASGVAVWLGLLASIAAVRAGRLDGVALAVVTLTPIAIHEVASGLVPAAQHAPGLASMARRVLEVTSRPDPTVEPTTPQALPQGPFGLRCRGLRARYPLAGRANSGTKGGVAGLGTAADETTAATADSETQGGPAVRDALVLPDFEIRSGESLLVTGPSGSGKSTFAALLVRFLEPSAGSVELVGRDRSVDLRLLSSNEVRRVICLCTQDPHIFDTSVVENVRLARPAATDAEVRAAVAAAQLVPWIDSLPEGVSTMVGEHGARMSGGQRQRLSLARALLADAPVIVFDEPTEHLDQATAIALTADLLAATLGRTIVMITHRPELMASARWSARVDLEPRD